MTNTPGNTGNLQQQAEAYALEQSPHLVSHRAPLASAYIAGYQAATPAPSGDLVKEAEDLYPEDSPLGTVERWAYISGATPRQQRIEELEGHNRGLHDKLQDMINVNIRQDAEIVNLKGCIKEMTRSMAIQFQQKDASNKTQ
jgi:hypothetical protein